LRDTAVTVSPAVTQIKLDTHVTQPYIATVTSVTRRQEQPTLKERRLKVGRSLDDVAAGVGVAARTYRRWENDEKRPVADNLIRLARYWRVHPKNLFPLGELVEERR
jgi:DNA-binding XRE family transcriptional regulator